MTLGQRAGKPADPSILVDVDRLVARLLRRAGPDPADPGPARRVRHLRPPRLVAHGVVQRGPHPRHDAGDLPLPARHRASTARSSSAATRTRCPSPPSGPRSRCSSRTASTCCVDAADGYTPTPAISHAILAYNRGRTDGLGRRHRRHAVAQPARGRRLQVQPAARRPGRHRRHRLDRGRGERAARGRPRRRPPRARSSARARPPRPYDFLGAYVDDLGTVIDIDAIRGSGLRIGVDPLGGASVDYWPAIGERYGLDLTVVNEAVDPTFRFMTRRLGRQDPDGPVVAVRDGRRSSRCATASTSPSATTPTPTATASSRPAPG